MVSSHASRRVGLIGPFLFRFFFLLMYCAQRGAGRHAGRQAYVFFFILSRERTINSCPLSQPVMWKDGATMSVFVSPLFSCCKSATKGVTRIQKHPGATHSHRKGT